jgi:hypothetical protein
VTVRPRPFAASDPGFGLRTRDRLLREHVLVDLPEEY